MASETGNVSDQPPKKPPFASLSPAVDLATGQAWTQMFMQDLPPQVKEEDCLREAAYQLVKDMIHGQSLVVEFGCHDRPAAPPTPVMAQVMERMVKASSWLAEHLNKLSEHARGVLLDRLMKLNPVLYRLVRFAQDRLLGTQLSQLREVVALRKELGLADGQAIPDPARLRDEAEKARAEEVRLAAEMVDVEAIRRKQRRRVRVDKES